MKKIIVLFSVLLYAHVSLEAQAPDSTTAPLYGAFNSEEYLRSQNLLNRVEIYRAYFKFYKDRAHISDTVGVAMEFVDYDPDEKQSGVYALYAGGKYKIHVTLDRLRNDTSIFFIYFLNRELCKIKLGFVDKTFTEDEKFPAGFELWICVLESAGEEQSREYTKASVRDPFERENELQAIRLFFKMKEEQMENEKK